MAQITKDGKCGECGSKDFFLNESIGWKGYTSDGDLILKHKNNSVDSIECDGCQTNFTEEDFTTAGITLNFQ